MDKIQLFFKNISTDENDFRRLVTQIKELVLGNDGGVYFFYGNGNNGKSMVMNLVKEALNDDSFRRISFSSITEGSDISDIISVLDDQNYRCLEVVETDEIDKRIDIKIIQNLTSGSYPRKIIFMTNMNPSNYIGEIADTAFSNKVKIIQFKKVIDNPNNDFCMEIINNYAKDLRIFLQGIEFST